MSSAFIILRFEVIVIHGTMESFEFRIVDKLKITFGLKSKENN